MEIAVIGRGNVGGGLAARWQRAGHRVTTLGRDGGDVSAADVLLVAVPSDAIEDALARAGGAAGKPAIDATNVVGERDDGFESNAHRVQAALGGPVAKAFNLVFARLYDRLDEQPVRPSVLYAADDAVREVTERLIRDAGYEPVGVGGLDRARALEDHLATVFAVGPGFHRYWKPGEL